MNPDSKKKIIVIGIALAVSVIIWNINASWGNTFITCLVLSITTFLIIYTPFEIYFNIRTIWFERWKPIHHEDLIISKIKIRTIGGNLIGNVIKCRNREKVESKNSLIIINHGFSDDKESHQYLLYPLALQGFIVLSYDARGTGESKYLGQRVDFLERKKDFIAIVDWLCEHGDFSKKKLITIGFSIGALVSLTAGFENERIEKIICISTMADYINTSHSLNPIIKLSYFLNKVDLKPSPQENYELSPALIIKNSKSNLPKEDWNVLSKRVYLIHNKNDRIIKFENFEVLRDLLELPNRNVFVSQVGGHSYQRNEINLVAAVFNFLNV